MDSRKTAKACLCGLWIAVVCWAFPYMAIGASPKSELLSIYVVNYPLKYFAERIADGHATVEFPCPSGEDPAYWTPSISTISAYQQADLILLNGAHYAKWVQKVSLPRAKLVDTSIKFKDRYVKLEEAVTHSHGPEGKHAHEGVAFTTWLDFNLAGEQAEAILAVLVRKRPRLRSTFQRNYDGLRKDLEVLDRDIQAIVSKDPSRPVIASHPVYQYFANRYGLNIKSVHWEPDQAPGETQWRELKELLRNHPAKWMIWEGEPMQETRDKLKSLGVESLVFHTCGNAPSKGDFIVLMRENVRNLRKALE